MLTCGERRVPRSRTGQSSVEAAVLLPVLMLVFALLVQPCCLLLTRMIMGHVAAQTVRVAAFASEATARAYALRRLEAVPEASPFHVGGRADWDVGVSHMGDGRVRVRIVGHARPLPLLGSLAALAGMRDGRGVVLAVEVCERVRPEWLGGSHGT